MQRRLYKLGLAVLIFLLLGTGQAGATAIVEPPASHHPYQRWADESKMPTPEVTLTVIEEPCYYPNDFAWGCTGSGTYTIYDAAPDRETFLHEMGHNFDYYSLPSWGRERFLALTEDGRDWEADPNGPNEGFASAYGKCAVTGPKFHGDPLLNIKGSGGSIRQTTYRKICRMILNVG